MIKLPHVGWYRYFEYHCYEGHDSQDAELWYRSHRRVKVLALDGPPEEFALNLTPRQRGLEGIPLVFRVRFTDGHEGTAFEDELLISKRQYERPDPPLRRVGGGGSGGRDDD